MSEPILAVDGLETCYGLSQVLFGVSFTIAPGEMVTLMGRNGMGKTTTVRSVMGLTPARAGRVRLGGAEIRGLPAYKIAKLGLGLVPEGRQIFPNLTVRENLVATAAGEGEWTLARVHELFPRLAERETSMGTRASVHSPSSPRRRARANGRSRACTSCFHGWPSAKPAWATSFPAASSRCSPSAAR